MKEVKPCSMRGLGTNRVVPVIILVAIFAIGISISESNEPRETIWNIAISSEILYTNYRYFK